MPWSRQVAAIGLLALGVSACGTRLPHEQIVAAAVPELAQTATNNGAAAASSDLGAVQDETSPDDATGSSGPAVGTTGRATPSAGTAPVVDDGGNTAAPPESDEGAPGDGSGTPDGDVPPPPAQSEAPPETSDTPVKIGHFGTYSGVVGAILKAGRPTAQAWAQSVNARGGLNGHPVEIITADDGGDPARAQSLARQMVEEQGVVAFVGNLTPLSIEGYSDYLGGAGVPLVGSDITVPLYHEARPMLFPQGPHIDIVATGQAREPVRRDAGRLGVLICVEQPACGNSARVIDQQAGAVGAEVVYRAEVSLAQPNFTRECLAMAGNDVQTVVLLLDSNSGQRVARDCSSQGFTPDYNSSAIAADNNAAQDPNLAGYYAITQTFPWNGDDTAAAVEFQEAMQTYAPDVVLSGSASLVWTSGKLLEAGARDLPAEPTAQDIVDGLNALPDGYDIEGLTVGLTFRDDGSTAYDECYFQTVAADGRWTTPTGSEPLCL